MNQHEFQRKLAILPESSLQQINILHALWIETTLSPMVAIADQHSLHLLEFVTRPGLEKELTRLRSRGYTIIAGTNAPLQSIKNELNSYFNGQLTQFKTPFFLAGSAFQKKVWQALCQIPYGETRSYAEQATSIGKPTAYRAVANANGANQLAIIVPCHRIISSNGTLGGYGGGTNIKQRLLHLESIQTHMKSL